MLVKAPLGLGWVSGGQVDLSGAGGTLLLSPVLVMVTVPLPITPGWCHCCCHWQACRVPPVCWHRALKALVLRYRLKRNSVLPPPAQWLRLLVWLVVLWLFCRSLLV